MEEKQQCRGKCCRVGAAAPFVLGLVLALTFGWWVFPDLLYSKKAQPVEFSHSKHMEAGLDLECSSCHYLRADGSFSGLPKLLQCASCHNANVTRGNSEAEKNLIANYVIPKKELVWQAHQSQPDNVFFSHAAHMKDNCLRCHTEWTEQDLCSSCHLTLPELDKNPPRQENMLTGYSRTTMKMWECEQCHAKVGHYKETNSNNACYTCHK